MEAHNIVCTVFLVTACNKYFPGTNKHRDDLRKPVCHSLELEARLYKLECQPSREIIFSSKRAGLVFKYDPSNS